MVVFRVDFQGFVLNNLANLTKESPLRTAPCAKSLKDRDTPWDPYYSHTGNLS